MPRPALESAEELAGMFALDEFAVEATFTDPTDTTTFQAPVIFDREHFEADAGEAAVSTYQPQLEAPTESLPGVAKQWRVQVDGQAFRVWDRRDDGTGSTVLVLHAE